MPSNTGRPGGKRTGRAMLDYIIKGGLFEASFKEIKQNNDIDAKLPYLPNAKLLNWFANGGQNSKGLSGVKITYNCYCRYRVWGKCGLKIKCVECGELFLPMKKSK
ncbi:hypothetical protein [Niabella hibiscisoli]|uniref:hypothetical protein n=1 Tax=Niabella hibiscisoli TaxID=1825928 RepID=UPI001F10592D|nr:hypothetical protein [Niabella hibiscisoli]MCH5716702.1 hypothetical protein [Niabella hibiscisoli]